MNLFLKSVVFVTSTFSKTETVIISILFAIDIIIYQCILKFLSHVKIIVIKNNTYWAANNIFHAESIRLIESSNINEKTGLS